MPGAVTSHVNITRRKMAEQELAHKAAHDPLTGVANRDLFTARLGAALAKRSGRPARADVRPQDTVARLGGDEFAVTAPRITADGLAALAARITGALAEPHLIHGQSVQVPASVGTHLAGPGDVAGDALRRADRAMYIVKRAIHPGSGSGPGRPRPGPAPPG
jgi:GGDEF domain-containing protein